MSTPLPEFPQRDWLTHLLVQHEASLLKYAYSLCHDRELARDTVQEVFLRLIRAKDKGMPDNVTAWLYSVCRNVITDYRRRQDRVKFGWEVEENDVVDNAPLPGEDLQQSEVRHHLAQMVDELPDRERQLVKLKFEVGLSYKEIEEITGISQGNIGYFLHQAVQVLKQRWQVEGGRP